MSEVAYSEFFKYTIPLVPNASIPLATQTIRSACIDFCSETCFFQEAIDPLSSVAGESVYEIDVPTGYDLDKVLSLYYEERKLTPISKLELTGRSYFNWSSVLGTPRLYVISRTSEVTLVPIPDKNIANAITGRISIVPSRSSTTVDDDLLSNHAETIAYGAASLMMQIPNQPFSDPAGSKYFGQMFSAEKTKRKIQVNQGNVQALMQVQMRQRF